MRGRSKEIRIVQSSHRRFNHVCPPSILPFSSSPSLLPPLFPLPRHIYIPLPSVPSSSPLPSFPFCLLPLSPSSLRRSTRFTQELRRSVQRVRSSIVASTHRHLIRYNLHSGLEDQCTSTGHPDLQPRHALHLRPPTTKSLVNNSTSNAGAS